MATLPAAGYIAGPRTKGEQKTALEDVRNVIAQLPGGDAEPTLTIAAGVVTATKGIHSIDTESAAATDDLTNILQTNLPDGSLLYVRCVSASRVVVLKHAAGGTGQLSLKGGADVSLNDTKKWVLLKRSGALWEEISLGDLVLSILTTKGDGYRRTASAVVRMAVGADGHVEEADSTQATGTKWAMPAPSGHGQLQYVSGTQIKFAPRNGTRIPVKTGGVWRTRDIGSGIVSANPTAAANVVNGVASQVLAANTTYLVTVFDNAGTLTFDFLTTLTHAVDATTGVEIKSGDDTRTVVGLIRTNATPNFVDSATQRFVRSWFNRPAAALRNSLTADRTTTSTTFVEIHTEIRVEAVLFADDVLWFALSGSAAHPNFGAVGIGVDGTTKECAVAVNSGTSPASVAVSGEKSGLADGHHYVTALGRSNNAGNTLTLHGVDAVSLAEQVRLHAVIRS